MLGALGSFPLTSVQMPVNGQVLLHLPNNILQELKYFLPARELSMVNRTRQSKASSLRPVVTAVLSCQPIGRQHHTTEVKSEEEGEGRRLYSQL